MSSFTTLNLVDNQVLVKGTDNEGTSNQAVLDGTQWAEVNSHKEYDLAVEGFTSAVEAFFAPLEAAKDKMEAALNKPTDSLAYVVLHEAVEGQQAQSEDLIKLTPDSMVLRLLEQGDHDRLVWVGESLAILAVLDTPVPFDVAEVTEDDEPVDVRPEVERSKD